MKYIYSVSQTSSEPDYLHLNLVGFLLACHYVSDVGSVFIPQLQGSPQWKSPQLQEARDGVLSDKMKKN